MGLKPGTRVRWMKAFDSMPEGDAVAAVPRSMGHHLEACGAALAGSADALAVYIKIEPNPDYPGAAKSLPGAIAGLLWLKPMPAGRGIRDFREDARYPLGWPVTAIPGQGPDLKSLVRSLYPASFSKAWEGLRLMLKDGKPFPIDRHPWSPLGDELSRHYQHL